MTNTIKNNYDSDHGDNPSMAGGDGAHPGRTSGTKRILRGLIIIVLALVFVLNSLNLSKMKVSPFRLFYYQRPYFRLTFLLDH